MIFQKSDAPKKKEHTHTHKHTYSYIYTYIHTYIHTYMIRTSSRTDANLIHLVPKIESKSRTEWNRDPILNETTNLGM